MIKQEFFMTRSDGVVLHRTYSDAGKKILQVETGIVYEEAIDVYPVKYTYEEYEETEGVNELDEKQNLFDKLRENLQ